MTVNNATQHQAMAAASSEGGVAGSDLTLSPSLGGDAGAHFGLPPRDDQPVEEKAQNLAASQESDSASDRRRYERTTVLWSSRIMFKNIACDCVIINISAEGAMIQLSEPVEKGTAVLLYNDRLGGYAGKVSWQKDNQCGLGFYEDPEEIAQVLGRVLPQR